jgi:hypothetical protein
MRRHSVVLVLLLALAVGLPAPALAEHVALGQPEAEASLGSPIVFRTSIVGSRAPEIVELLVELPGEDMISVLPAAVVADGDGWLAEATLEGHSVANTRFNYRFRVRDAAEQAALGPEATAVVSDDRFAWRTVNGPLIRLHWYEGDEAFAQRALEIGERAVANAAELLGVSESDPIDFFIYDSPQALAPVLGPGSRENVGGQAHAEIRTMFGLIEPNEINSDWVDTLVAHELTHLVFDTATGNPYHAPPRWLNEGIAVYLSEGYNASWRAVVEAAVGQGAIIPLDGLGGLFPTTADRFRLAYGESVSAVDFFIRTYDEQTLWSLVRSYADGVSDDDAFRAATGADMGSFNEAWMGSLGLGVPEPLGPRAGQPGPLPADWQVGSSPPPAAGPTPATGEQRTPGTGAGNDDEPASPTSPAGDGGDNSGLLIGLALALAVVVGVVVLALVYRRRLLT